MKTPNPVKEIKKLKDLLPLISYKIGGTYNPNFEMCASNFDDVFRYLIDNRIKEIEVSRNYGWLLGAWVLSGYGFSAYNEFFVKHGYIPCVFGVKIHIQKDA